MTGETEGTSITGADFAPEDETLDSLEQQEEETTTEETSEEEVETEEEETPTEKPEEKVPEGGLTSVASELAGRINTKYPGMLKEFPEVRTAIFKAAKYEEAFPTIEMAKEASGKVEQFEALGGQLFEGNIGALLDSVYEVDKIGPEAVTKLVTNFLPTIFNKSPELWQQAVNPIFRQTINEMRQQAKREGDKALWATANNISLFLYGSKDTPAAPVKQGPDPEKEDLKRQLGQHQSQQEQIFISGMKTEIDSLLSKEINQKLDASVAKGLRDVIVERTIDRIGTIMRQNQENRALITRLGDQAKRSGYSAEHRKAIIEAYVRPARVLVSRIASEVATEITGNKVKAVEGSKKIGGQAPGGTPTGKINAKDVDWQKTGGTRGFLNGNVVLKK